MIIVIIIIIIIIIITINIVWKPLESQNAISHVSTLVIFPLWDVSDSIRVCTKIFGMWEV